MRPHLRRLLSLLVATSLASVVVTTPAAAGALLRLEVEVGGPCVYGTGRPDTVHELILRAPDGRLRKRARSRTSSNGALAACFGAWPWVMINPRDTITVRRGAQRTRVRVPDVLPRIDRDADTVAGRGRPGARLRVEVQGATRVRSSVPVGDDGRWRLDPAVDILGGDLVRTTLRRGGHRFSSLTWAPYLRIGVDTNLVSGVGLPGQRVRVTLRREGVVVARAGTVSFLGPFAGALHDRSGRAVYPRPGDTVATDLVVGLRMVVPPLRLRGDATQDLIRLRCLPHAPYDLTVLSADGDPRRTLHGTTDAQGRAVRPDRLHPWNALSATCRYPSGDIVAFNGLVR